MQKLLFIFAATALICATICIYNHHTSVKLSSIPWNFTSCGSGAITTKSVALSQTPTKGQNIGVTISGEVTSPVDLSQVQIVTKVSGIWLDTRKIDDQNSYDTGDNFNFQYTVLIPSIAPKGTYTEQFTYLDDSGNSQGCINVNFTL